MFQCFFLHAVYVAALCLLLFFHLVELRAWLTLWLIAVSLAASLTYALLAAAVGPRIPRRPALAHLVMAGTLLMTFSLAGILFAWQDQLHYGHFSAEPLWHTFRPQATGWRTGGSSPSCFSPCPVAPT